MEPPDEAETEAIAAVSARQAVAARGLLSLDLSLPQAWPVGQDCTHVCIHRGNFLRLAQYLDKWRLWHESFVVC